MLGAEVRDDLHNILSPKELQVRSAGLEGETGAWERSWKADLVGFTFRIQTLHHHT